MKTKSGEDVDLENFKSKIGFGIKIWLEFQEDAGGDDEKTDVERNPKNILGMGWATLLESIKSGRSGDRKSLTEAAKECGYSYKYAWNILRRIEKRTGLPAVETSRGGSGGGGWIKLNEWGEYLLTAFNNLRSELISIEQNLKKSLKIE